MVPGVEHTDHYYDTAPALTEALATALAQRLVDGLAARGGATLVVCGGTSPRAILERLAQAPLDWSRVTIGLTDERWVPPGDPASNEGLARRTLLTGQAAGARLIGLYTGDPSPEEGEAACANRLEGMPRPFDAVLLGMGEDGHTASLLPRARGLAAAMDLGPGALCKAIHAPGAAHPRMTLTLPILLDARAIFLLFLGEAKRRVFEAALAAGPIEAMPVRAVLRQRRVPVHVFWSASSC